MNEPIEIENNKDYEDLIKSIENVVSNSKNKIASTINDTIVETYWNIGKYIIEFEQKGKIKAEYGKQLLVRLSKDLKLRLGKGYSRSNLYNMRKLYELYPIFQPLAGKLSWTNLCEILTIDNELVVEYATYNMDTNLFVSKYELYLPNREELKKLVDEIINGDS